MYNPQLSLLPVAAWTFTAARNKSTGRPFHVVGRKSWLVHLELPRKAKPRTCCGGSMWYCLQLALLLVWGKKSIAKKPTRLALGRDSPCPSTLPV